MLTIALDNKKSQVSEDIACVNGEDCFEYWIDLIKRRVMRNGIKVNIIMYVDSIITLSYRVYPAYM